VRPAPTSTPSVCCIPCNGALPVAEPGSATDQFSRTEDRAMKERKGKRGIDRREFVTTTTGAAAAVALGPTIWLKRPQKTLKILQWSHFVPSYDVWFDKYA